MTREEAAKVLEKQFDESCGDYRYQNKDKLDYEDALWLAIAALREQMKWISVRDRLPEEKVNCIVHYQHAYCDNDGYWAIGFCCYDGEKFQFDPAYKVTHWMPLPRPPKADAALEGGKR